MTEDNSIVVAFKGDGNAEIIGIPKRDLTANDWNELTGEQREHALNSGLYALVKPVSNKKAHAPDTGKDAS